MLAVVLADFVDRHYARVIKISGRFSLGAKTFDVIFTGQLPGQDHLQRDDTVETDLPRFVYYSHSTACDFFQ